MGGDESLLAASGQLLAGSGELRAAQVEPGDSDTGFVREQRAVGGSCSATQRCDRLARLDRQPAGELLAAGRLAAEWPECPAHKRVVERTGRAIQELLDPTPVPGSTQRRSRSLRAGEAHTADVQRTEVQAYPLLLGFGSRFGAPPRSSSTPSPPALACRAVARRIAIGRLRHFRFVDRCFGHADLLRCRLLPAPAASLASTGGARLAFRPIGCSVGCKEARRARGASATDVA